MEQTDPITEDALVAVPRLIYIDQLRALAALYVATFHVLLILWPSGGPSAPWYLLWAHYGHFGVTAFIVLSGFSLALKPAVRDKETAGHYWPFVFKRALRMLPPYWVALAGSVLLLVLLPETFTPINKVAGGDEWNPVTQPFPVRPMLAYSFLIHDLPLGFEARSPNAPFWSIALEWHLYFLFPLLIFFGCKFGMRWLLLGSGFVGVTMLAVSKVALGSTDSVVIPQYLFLFAVGIATAYGVGASVKGHDRPRGIPRINGWVLIAASFAAFVVVSEVKLAAADVVAGLIFALGVYILGCREESIAEVSKRSPRDWGGRSLVSIGLFSYSLYLVHVPVEKVVWHYIIEPLGLSLTAAFFMLTIAGVGAALAFAWGMHVFIERPSMRWSRQIRTDK